jgi:hypothetical protein
MPGRSTEKLPVEAPLFALNRWHDVAIEVRKGTILLQIEGVKHIFESRNIDMTGHAQIDFKAVDFDTAPTRGQTPGCLRHPDYKALH